MVKIGRISPGGAKLTTDTGVRQRSPEAEQLESKAMGALGETIQKGADKFYDLHIKHKTNEAKLATYKGISEIESMAQNDVNIDDPDVQEGYRKQIGDLREKVLSEMPDGEAKASFASEFELSAIKTDIQIKSFGRQALMHKTIANHQEAYQIIKKEYGEANKEGRVGLLKSAIDGITALEQDGFMSHEDAQKNRRLAKEELNTAGAIKDTEKYGADYVIKNIGDYDVEDKEKLTQEVRRVGLLRKKQVDLNQEIIYQKGQQEIIEVLDREDMDYIDKLDFIEQKEKYGEADAGTVKLAKQNLSSSDKLADTTHTNDYAEVVRVIGDLNIGKGTIKDGKNSIEYLKKVKSAKNYVLGLRNKGKLTKEDYTTLMTKISTDTADEQTKATELIAKKRSLGWDNFGYNDADKYFKDNLVADSFRNEALRQYFDQVSGNEKNLNTKERKEIADQVMASVKGDALTQAVEEEKPAKSFTTVKEADSSGLPSGTIVLVGGKRYRI